jgi:hypothetical protein
MAGFYERRENGDGTVSQNVAVTDSDAVLPIDLRYHGMDPLNPLVTKGYVTQVQAHNATTIRDLANSDVSVDVSTISGEKFVIVNSSLNQAVDVTLYAEGTGYTFASMGASKNLAAGGIGLYTSADWPALKAPLQKIRIRMKASVAPTTGSIGATIEGVQS